MTETTFHIKKQLLKEKINFQETLLKNEIDQTFTKKNILLSIIPNAIKDVFIENSNNTNFQTIDQNTTKDVLSKTQKILETLVYVSKIAKQFTSKK